MATAPATAVTAAPTAQNVASATASSAAATTAAPAPPPAPETVSELMQRKIQLEEDLKNMEKQIRELEDSYIGITCFRSRCADLDLEDTHQYGNVIKGWEGYLNVKPKAPTSRTRIKISNRFALTPSSCCLACFTGTVCFPCRLSLHQNRLLATTVSKLYIVSSNECLVSMSVHLCT